MVSALVSQVRVEEEEEQELNCEVKLREDGEVGFLMRGDEN